MIVVIISGGSGARLWPLSTNAYPKQLLKLTSENRLIQDTYTRIRLLTDKIYLVSEKSHSHHLKSQLQNVDDEYFIVEPCRRGTANCVIASLSQIAKKHDPDEPIIFVSTDHHIRDNEGFKYSFNIAADISKRTKKIVLVGIELNYPATGFGYIERGQK